MKSMESFRLARKTQTEEVIDPTRWRCRCLGAGSGIGFCPERRRSTGE